MIVHNEGTIVTFEPESAKERKWLESETNAEPWQWLGRSLAVDRRCAGDLVEGIAYTTEFPLYINGQQLVRDEAP